jgi:hypothetical protein
VHSPPVIASEAKQSTHIRLRCYSCFLSANTCATEAAAYWMPAFAGMTLVAGASHNGHNNGKRRRAGGRGAAGR